MLDAQVQQLEVEGQQVGGSNDSEFTRPVNRVIGPAAFRRPRQNEHRQVESNEVAPRKAAGKVCRKCRTIVA
jgi:hypothetical protein